MEERGEERDIVNGTKAGDQRGGMHVTRKRKTQRKRERERSMKMKVKKNKERGLKRKTCTVTEGLLPTVTLFCAHTRTHTHLSITHPEHT